MVKTKNIKIGICRLCLNNDKLCFSHIIPEFLYERQYNEKHQMLIISNNPEDHHSPTQQKGIREFLLCESCETKFSKWESYAKETLIKLKQKQAVNGIIHLQNIDYPKFKLFLMSILWRMSVSKLTAFKQVHLDNKREKALRAMLNCENPGKSSEFICKIRVLTHDNHQYNSEQLMIPSLHINMEGVHDYLFVIFGLAFDYIITNNMKAKEKYLPSLSKYGDLWVETSGDQFAVDYFISGAASAISNNPKIAKMWERDKAKLEK